MCKPCHSERSEESQQKIDRRANFLYDNTIIAGSSNGRTWAFEAQYLGSSPSPAVFDSNVKEHKYTSDSFCDKVNA